MRCRSGLHEDDFKVDSRGKKFCRPCGIEATRRWQARNVDRVRSYQQDYREANQDRLKADYKRWQQEHRLERAAHENGRRALKRSAKGSVSAAEFVAVLASANHCLVPECGATENLQVDHVVPLALGGAHSIENLQVLCGKHNASKGARAETDYRTPEFHVALAANRPK